jgi:porin
MHFFYSLGIGGKGVIPGRERDRYGFGFYYIDVNNPKLQGLFQTIKLLRDEYGFEAFYNIAITPWLLLTPDIQVIRGAQKDKIKIGTGSLGVSFIADRKSIGTATILGIRLSSCSEAQEYRGTSIEKSLLGFTRSACHGTPAIYDCDLQRRV